MKCGTVPRGGVRWQPCAKTELSLGKGREECRLGCQVPPVFAIKKQTFWAEPLAVS